MAPRASLDEKLAVLRGLRGRALSPEQKAEVRKRIGDRSNLVVAAAATIAGEDALVELTNGLEAPLDRLPVHPLRPDKPCRAKRARVRALARTERPGPDVFRKGATHVQLEPVWGGSED